MIRKDGLIYMSLDILKTRIKENKLDGVILFCGQEEYTKDHFASQIRKKVDSSPLPEFNHIYFNAESDKMSELEDAVYSLPYMWDTKLIEITNLESAKITESDINDYERIFSEIPDYLTVLVVLRADAQIEKKKSKDDEEEGKSSRTGLPEFVKLVAENGLVVRFESEKSDKLVSWISRHFNAKGVKFDISVPREMVNICGSDMYILQGEILKLTEVYTGTQITASDVRKYCCANSAYKYFDIAAALNRRDLVSAKRIFDSLDLPRDKVPMAVGAIARNYSDMLLVKTGLDSGKSFDIIAKDMKKQSWQVRKMSQSLGQSDVRALSFAITQLSNADLKLKSYRGDPKRILELAFYRICTYGRKA